MSLHLTLTEHGHVQKSPSHIWTTKAKRFISFLKQYIILHLSILLLLLLWSCCYCNYLCIYISRPVFSLNVRTGPPLQAWMHTQDIILLPIYDHGGYSVFSLFLTECTVMSGANESNTILNTWQCEKVAFYCRTVWVRSAVRLLLVLQMPYDRI